MAQWWETPAASLNPPEPVPPQTPNTPSFGAQDNPYLRSALSTYQQMRDQSRANLTPATAAPPPVAPVEPPPKEEGWASKIGGTILTPIAETLTQMGPALYNVADAASGGYLDEGRRRLQAGVQNLLGDEVKWQQIAPMAEGAARVKAPLEHYESEGLKAGRQQLSQAQGVGESLKTVATNPYLLAGMVAESLPWMVGIAGPAKAAATAAFEGALAKGATQAVAEAAAKTAATRASIAGNFAISGGTSGLSAQERIYGMSEAELANSPAYQQLRQQGLDHRAAQESMARSANVKTTAIAGALGAGATAALGGGLEAQIAQRLAGVAGPSQGVIKNVLGGAAREGTEEYLQSGGERLGENIGLQAVDPTLTPMTRVFEDAAVGALVGAVAGGTFGAFGDTDRSRQGRAGQDATQRADLARVALSDLDEPRLAAAAEQARKVLVDNPRMPARQRQALESALGHLDADLQGRANGEGLRQVLADPAQLQTLRGQATLAGMADDARVSQINDEELMTAAEQAVAMAQTPALGQGLQQQFIEVAQAYAGHLKTRQQLANLDAALQADPTVAPSLAARIAQAATGQPKKGITPEYSRASLDDTELTRHLTAADRLLSQHSGRLDEDQRTRLTDARTALQAEREQRAANPDWQARNAQIIQANDPREVRLRQSFAKNPEKTVARLTANDAPLIDTLIQSFASRAENYTQTGFPAPEEITRPLTLLQARKAALATEATQQQQATEKKRQTDYLQQRQAPVPTLADALNLTPTNADPLGDWLSQRANIADEQGQMLKRTLAALQSPPADPAQQQRAQESRRLQAARLTGELIQQGVVEQADRAQTQADIDAWIGSGGRPRTSGVIGQMGQPLGNPQAEPAPQGSQELSRLLGPDTSPAPATPAAPSQPQSLADLLQRDSTASNVQTAPLAAQGPISPLAAPAPRPRPKLTQKEVKATQASAQGRQDQARGEQSGSVGSTITPDTPYDDLVRMTYAGTAARRRLRGLPPTLERNVMRFAQTGQPATPKAVRAWLETQGTIGAVSDLVSKILKHQKDAQAALAEGLALPELNRREQARRDRREQQEQGKSAPAPDLQPASEKSAPASVPAPQPSPENANENGQTETETETLLNTEPADTPLLSSDTPAELKARQAADEKAAQQKAAKEQAADEKAAADRERNGFTLAGSDRPADVAMSQGQTNLLDAMDGKAPAKAAPATPPADYGANNTLVSRERAEELRKKLRAKFGQLNAGVDPEIVAMGTELAVFHLEAGARKFAQFVQDLANDLGLTVAQMRPYLRGWYNGARDMMEDSGQDVSAMDTSDQVKAALATLAAPIEVDMFGAPEPGHRIAKLETVEIPLDQLKLSDDVPQFKSGANAKSGVVEPLGGTFDRTGVAPIQVWKRLNGDLEVISGRHRLDLARRSGEKTLPAQIHNEADGFDAKKAGIIDAELNIRDGQGKVKDYVDYFINSKISEAEANLRGLISRFIGKTAFRIANDGSAELIASHRANALSDEAANSIALAAPGNSRLQAVAIKAVLDGKSIIQAVNTLQAVKALASEQGDSTGDMFGLDDSAMREAEQMATIASRRQRQLSERLAAAQGAAKRPELARKEGVDVKDKAALDAKITEIKREREAWDRWSTNPDLIASIRDELKPGQKTPVTATPKPAEKQAAPSTDVVDIAAKDEARKQAILGHLTKLGWKPDGSQLSWNIGGAPKGGELNPFGNRLATVEIRSGFVSLLRNNGMDDPVYMVKHSISEGVSPQTIAQQFHAKVMAITAPENRAENKPNTPTGQNNETSTRQSVESRGENRPAGNGMGKGDVQPDGAGVGRGNEPGGTTDAGLGSSEQGDAGVPDNDPAVSGTKGAGRVHQPDGEPRPAERVPERGDSGRGGDPGRARVQSEPRRNETTAVDAGTPNAQLALDAPTEPALEVVPVPRPDFAAKKEAQRQAASLAVIPGDLDNIRATLPFLLPEQQEDVLKAEQRFEKHNGMLFTNGTGSGKTFTGLGVIARMVRQGKSNGIIVVPSQSKVEDWIRDGVNLGLKVSALPDTRTAGEGLVITTYANYAANDALNKRNWDFIVYDEAHKLASSQTGDSTVYQNRHEQTALLPDGILNRAQSLLSDKEKITQKRHNEILKEHNSLRHGRDLTEEEKAEKKRINLKLIQLEDDLEALPKPKILFLSATPFAYHDNLDYAAGLLFDWGPKPESRGYNTPNARQAFMMLHFGYRMRNGKLTKPEADVNVDLMERRFFEGLRRSGAVSGRKLVIEQDYSREFIEINNTLGHGLDRGISVLMGYSDEGRNAKGDRRFPNLGAELSKQLDFLSKTRLLEGIKAKSAAERAQQHIAMGRKVVVFHDYIEGNPRHPFLFAERPIRADDDAVLLAEKTVWNQQVLEFNREFPELAQLPINNLAPVIPTFMKVFGAQVRLFNGRISTQARAQALRDFNADGSDVQVLVVQRDAGKEGISLHDVSGQHQRVLMDLGLPTAPTEAIQTEGRIYRYGQASNAIIEYLKTNTSFEQHLFGSRVAARARTAENLAMGDEARNLERAFIEAYLNSHHDAPQANQGQGGKASDARVNSGDPYDNAISFYFANRKKTARDKSREGTDYYATPEPIGFKMVEWADLKPNESALEPSAGHGAIARFFPEDTQNSFIEPSRELMTLLEVNARGKVMNDTFENLHINNKYDAIVMNPPFGSGGATAVAHLEKAAGHLREGGRIVVLLPDGPAADKKLEKFLFGEKKPIKPLVTHPTLGPLYFGDTVTIEAFGTKNTFVLNSVVDGRFLREKDTPASGAINMIAATAVEPTGQRAIQSIADSLYPVADIGLPAVTFQRAGTSVKTHILVLEKHNDPQSAPPRMARMDMAGETIKELFEGLRSLSVLPRSAVTRTKDTRADAAKGMTAKAETPAPTLSSGTIPTTLRTTTHAKKSREAGRPVPWFVVTLDQKLGSDAYSQVAALAKKNKGFWSSYRGDGAIPGFQFSTEAAAKAFQSAVREQERYTAATRTDEGSSREVQEPKGNNTRRRVAPSNGDLFASGKIPGQLEFLSASPVVAKETEKSVRQRFGTVVESVKSGSLDTGITRVQTPEDAAHVLVSLAEEAQEHVMALVTDRKGNILSVIRHSVGTMNSSTVERAVLQGAIHSIQGAADVWLAHNHPSGNISQSDADITITNALWKNLDRTGVEVRGMIVITAEQTASFYNPNSGTQASYPISITEAQRGSQVPVTTRKIRQMTDQPVANDPIAMMEAMKRHSGGMDGILLLDNSMHPVDFVPMTVDQMRKMRGGKSEGAARLYRALHESNANSFAATMRMDRDSHLVAAAIDNLSRFANANALTFADAILGGYRQSWRSAANLPSVKGDQFFAQANASSPSAVTDALKALSGDATVQRLIDGGTLQVVKRQSQLPASIKIPAGQRVSGAVDPDSGVVYLIAENIAPGEIEGFLRHEVGVHQAQLGLNQPKSRALRLAHALARLVGARQILGEPSFNDALAQLQRMRAVGNTRVLAAYAAAEKAMGNLNQSPELLHEEALAYLLGDPKNRNLSIVRRLMAAIRAFLYKAGLKINLTENDLQALAVSALRGVAQGKMRTGAVSKGVMGRNSEDVEAQRQYAAVVARYTSLDGSKKDGWMKAPNGQPTKLTERQWVQVQTDNFKQWFDGSKVIDANGEPLVMWHGSTGEFDAFNPKSWFALDPKDAAAFGTPQGFFVRLTNATAPNNIQLNVPGGHTFSPKKGEPDGRWTFNAGMHFAPVLIANNGGSQIKSATDNTGAFSPANPNIRFAYTLGQAEADLTAEEVLRRVEAGGEVTADEFSLLQAYLSGASRALTATGLDAPTFKTWFGASKIKGKTGQPLKMYHGTMTDFNVFDAAKAGASTPHPTAALGFFFTNDRDHAAEKYGDQVMEVYLAIEKPYVMTDADLRQIDNREDALTFRQKLEARGYDGLVFPAETKTRYVAAFRPDQIKRTTNQTYTRGENDIRFALANPRPLTPEQQAAMDKIGRREPQGWGMRFSGLRERMGLKLRQAIADHHAALLDLDRQAYGAGVVENQTAAASWVKARLSRSVDGPMHLLLHESGLRMDADGALDVLSSVKGLQKVLAPLGTEVDDFMKWVAGNRAERLMQEGRENLFTAEDIAALKTLNKGVMADGRNRATVYASALKDFVALQKSVMDIAEQSGLIDGNERSVWEHDFYVPFYRLAEDTQDVRSINAGDGLVRQEAFKRLKGGKDRLNDLLENTVMNWQHLLSASLKNNAARQALTNAQRVRYDGQAVAEPLNPSRESTKGAVYYRQNGQPQWFRVNDPLVLEAITALDFNGLKGPVMNVLRKARHLLTRTTTISPAFKVANLLRDTVQTLAVSQASAKTGGLGNIVQGWKHYAADSAIRQQMLAGGGAFLFGSTLEDHAEAMKKLLAKGVRPATILDTPAKLWDVLSLAYWKYEAFGDRLENVNRAALYEQLRKQGKSHLYASFQARDLLDFSQSGASGAVRFLTAVVPFLNARIQGLDKLGRAASQPAQRGRFALTLAALTLASAALYLLYKDDDDFKEREEWDRDTYWWFKIGDTAFRIPKPFEVGALATLLGDRVMEQMVDDEATPQLYLSRLKHTLTQTFSVSLPQLFAPAVDVWRNRGSFTQRPIETLAQQRLSPQLRQNANTSDVARGVSTATMGFLSPLQADYLIAGYFGWVGRQAVLMADYATRPVTDRPSPDRLPVIHDLIQRFVPTEQGGNSKYLTRFYEAAKTAEQHYADIQELIKRGETDAAKVLVQRHREDLTRLKLYRKASAQLNDWNNQLRVLADLPASQISTDQRQSARDALQANKLRLARALMEGQPAN
jgi:hypothetical protein